MTTYNPDKWDIIAISSKEGFETPLFKIMASWYGGFTGSDSWKLSSGVTKIEDRGAYYAFHNESGSIYNCNKQTKGMSFYTYSVYSGFVEDVKDKDFTISLMDSVESMNLPVTLNPHQEPLRPSAQSTSNYLDENSDF